MVASFAVDFESASDEERLDLWADTVRPLYDFSPLSRDQACHLTLARAWLLDKVVCIEFKFGAQLIKRDKRRHASVVTDMLAVQTYRYGDAVGEIGGMPHRVGPGEVNIIDYSRGHQSRWTPAHARSLNIAHDLVGYDPSRHPPSMRFGTETAVGYVLHQAIDAVMDQLDNTTDAQAPCLANGLIGLLRSVLVNDPEIARSTEDFAKARGRAIRRFIDQRIGQQARGKRLSPDIIAAQFHVSRATLYRDFKKEGGVERYILGRRLEAALDELAMMQADRGAVTCAAERWGFASAAHFSRAFRDRFGFSPSDVGGPIAQGVATSNKGGEGEQLRSFLKTL